MCLKQFKLKDKFMSFIKSLFKAKPHYTKEEVLNAVANLIYKLQREEVLTSKSIMLNNFVKTYTTGVILSKEQAMEILHSQKILPDEALQLLSNLKAYKTKNVDKLIDQIYGD